VARAQRARGERVDQRQQLPEVAQQLGQAGCDGVALFIICLFWSMRVVSISSFKQQRSNTTHRSKTKTGQMQTPCVCVCVFWRGPTHLAPRLGGALGARGVRVDLGAAAFFGRFFVARRAG
jgi:hypothetical protein